MSVASNKIGTLWIGGEWVNANDNKTFEVRNPDDDSLFATVAHGIVSDIQSDAVTAAKVCFASYSETLAKDREAWLMEAAHLMSQRKALLRRRCSMKLALRSERLSSNSENPSVCCGSLRGWPEMPPAK